MRSEGSGHVRWRCTGEVASGTLNMRGPHTEVLFFYGALLLSGSVVYQLVFKPQAHVLIWFCLLLFVCMTVLLSD